MSDETATGPDRWLDWRRESCPSFLGRDNASRESAIRDLEMSGPARPAEARARRVIRGLYAITPDWDDTDALVAAVQATLGAGTRLLQYRNKAASTSHQREQLLALKPLCERYGCILVVNDDWRLALELGIDAVHIGGDDGDAQVVRDSVGPDVILGVSCYADLGRARTMAPYADYLAFGSMFVSLTKPGAVAAPLGVLGEARALGTLVVAIGGINVGNAGQVLAAGADAVAVIGGVFGGGKVAEQTSALLQAIAGTRGKPIDR